jgi:hypothetical protein
LIRVVHFFQVNGLLPASQHGFLEGRCTGTALFEFFDNLHRSMEQRSKVLGIFYDLTNAFGSVCVPLIFQKFEHLGVRGVLLQWLKSVLSGRTQRVKLLEDLGQEIRAVFSDLVRLFVAPVAVCGALKLPTIMVFQVTCSVSSSSAWFPDGL